MKSVVQNMSTSLSAQESSRETNKKKNTIYSDTKTVRYAGNNNIVNSCVTRKKCTNYTRFTVHVNITMVT